MNKSWLSNSSNLVIVFTFAAACLSPAQPIPASEQSPNPIPFSELGSKATADYHGDAIGISVTDDGAQLRTAFQKLSGTATREGLWLNSTEAEGGRLRLVASAIGRTDFAARETRQSLSLPLKGLVEVKEKVVTFTRPGLVEEYSVSVDGVRQDFVIAERPAGTGSLCVELRLTGARADAAVYGARLTLEGSGRELAYSRLRVVDALGKELDAKMEVQSSDRLAIRVKDVNANYPVRIDPCFSDADWISLSDLQGANSTVNAIAVDGSGNIYFGGSFTLIGNVAANYIAKWTGSTWSALGSGVNSSVLALVIVDNNVYAGGFFTVAGGTNAVFGGGTNVSYIAKCDLTTTNWTPLGSGMSGPVYALATNSTGLFAGGSFIRANNSGCGPITVNNVAKWDGTAWSALGLGVNSTVTALAADDTNLYAGGSFTIATNTLPTAVVPVSRIAQWNFTAGNWSPLGLGLNSSVSALVLSGTNLYVGGAFTAATNSGPAVIAVSRVARWVIPTSTWTQMSGGLNTTVSALAVSGNTVFAGGAFTSRLAIWNGSTWSSLGFGINNTVSALAISGANLFVGGTFTSVTNSGPTAVTALRVAKLTGNTWSALGSGMNNTVYALAVNGDELYAGGDFTTARGIQANRVARWDGSSWSALGSGISGGAASVRSLAVIGPDVYAGGLFTTAGGQFTMGLAKWNTNSSTWSPVGLRLNGAALALAARGTDLYVGGDFDTVTNTGPVTVFAKHIAKWDTIGNTWSALGPGLTNNSIGAYVAALVVNDTNVFVGGVFTKAGALTVSNIACWDIPSATWSALASGMTAAVLALAISDTNLYAGGSFTTAGATPASHVARWNGSTWSALGSGVNGSIFALAASSDGLFAGGAFTVSGPTAVLRIAKWDGNFWSPVGSGMDAAVSALAADAHEHLFVGGSFLRAGAGDFVFPGHGPVSAYIAQANTCSEPPLLAPEIALEQPLGSDLASGGNRNFGDVAIGVPSQLDFVIRNLGTSDLTVLDITNDPVNLALFNFTPITTVLAPGASTNFPVTFTPNSYGIRATTIHIVNDDPDETNFTIFVSSLGPPPTLSPIPDQTILARSTTIATSTVPFQVGGLNITPSVSQVLPPQVMLGPGIFFQITAQPAEFAGSGPNRTVVLKYNIPTFSPLFSSFLFPADVQVTLSVLDSTGLSASNIFHVRLIDAPDVDGISDVVENAAPNSGDGNDDGSQDSSQSEVASLLSAADSPSYITLAVTNGLRLVDVQAITPPLPLPDGVGFPQGLIKFRLEGLPVIGASVTVTQIFQATLPDGLTYFKYGTNEPGSPATYYSFMYAPPTSQTGAEIITAENKIILHLTDGSLGDDDWTANGAITDPGGPALLSVEPVTLSITMLSPTAVQVAWPSPSTDWVLQQNTNQINSMNWSNVIDGILDDGTNKTFIISPPTDARFYRLTKP